MALPWNVGATPFLLVMMKSLSAGLAPPDRVSHSSISIFVNAPEVSSRTFYSNRTQLAILYYTANAAQCCHALHPSEEFNYITAYTLVAIKKQRPSLTARS